MSVDARVVVAPRGVDAQLQVSSGTTVVLMGPNGAGKSTLLEAIAGIVAMDDGHISVGGVSFASGSRQVLARQRGVGLVTQDDELFPTMSVRENVAFGPRAQGANRKAAHAQADAWLEKMGILELAHRSPQTLSGGQARRVAIARALASEPTVLLLDEPLARLDIEQASHIRRLLATVLQGMTAIVSTHDALDAHTLATEVAVMEAGRIVESGRPEHVLVTPRTAFGARMAGRQLLTGVMRKGALVVDSGATVPVVSGPGQGVRAAIAVRPTLVSVNSKQPGPAGALISEAVTAIEPRGDYVRVYGQSVAADIDVTEAATIALGQHVTFGLPAGLEAYAL